ncbi:MAG: peptidoglycan recognition family protein [Sumerlaeia bacterium]
MRRIHLLALLITAAFTAGCAGKNTVVEPYTVPMPTIITAAEWGSNPDSLVGREHTPKFATIHHAGVNWKPTDDPVAKLQGLQSWGKRDKQWPDVPYHYLISPDGNIYEGRNTTYEPETNTNYDTSGTINIHLWGNFDNQRATLEQIASTVAITAYVCQRYNISPETIGGHKDRVGPGETSCPGNDLYRYIENGSMQQWVEETLAGEQPVIALLDPLPEGPYIFIGQPLPEETSTP